MVTTRGVVAQMLTSDMGQTRTSTHPSARYALPLSTDIDSVARHVRKVVGRIVGNQCARSGL